MKSIVFEYQSENGWAGLFTENEKNNIQLVLVFGDRLLLAKKHEGIQRDLTKFFPKSTIIYTSTAGEIENGKQFQNVITCAALLFEKTTLKFSCVTVASAKESYATGKSIAESFIVSNLKHVLTFADGYAIKADELVKGITDTLPKNCTLSGALAGDGNRFEASLVGMNDSLKNGQIVNIAFYGKHFHAESGISLGMDIFGPERTITSSNENILYEIDNINALELYKKYLGKYADYLPDSAFHFPLLVKTTDDSAGIIRTVLSLDNEKGSMHFAGNVPEGAKIRFMKTNFDRMIQATNHLQEQIPHASKASFGLIISCVGRKVVLNNRIDEELETIKDIMPHVPIAGFFSYGEIGNDKDKKNCHLHNQSVIVTTFSED